MENTDVWLSRIGTFVTIVGAMCSLWGWKKSRDAATEAQKALATVNYQRSIRDAGNLHGKLSTAIKSLRAIGPGSNEENVRGISLEPIISEIEDFIDLFAAQAIKPNNKVKLSIDSENFCAEIRENLSELSDAKTPAEKLRTGRVLHAKILAIQPHIDLLVDDLTFNTQG
ncbi:hypothetical protein BvCmsA119A_01031 [Escherichia coli]|uniref:hypothetical protein n=1 Tax=Escherichia coli TaxID=562 RepID=UPI0010B6038F|nr:hypothetical protein [Escherichia coli]EFA4174311.1 hypothetical protein [Escherichia coli O163]GCJ37709.1 hypothetical protein BvCmsA119A_01031 [Escherichia coli]